MFFTKLLNIIFPSHCLYCDIIVSKNSLFCENCWSKLQFITDPQCPICSYPFEVEIPNMQPLCAKCVSKKPHFDSTITIYRYNYVIKKIIGDLKYRDKSFLIKKISQIILPKLRDQITADDILTAIPLHPNKLKKRKFNQSHAICQELMKKLPNKPFFYHDLLFRTRDTEPQVTLKTQQRSKNLKKAFITNQKHRDKIKDKRIFLFDDVVTTGATVNSCAKELKKRGAKEVIIVTLAKTAF